MGPDARSNDGPLPPANEPPAKAEEGVEGDSDEKSEDKPVPRPKEGEEKRGVRVGEVVQDGGLADEPEEEEEPAPHASCPVCGEEEKRGVADEELLEPRPGDEETLQPPARFLLEPGDERVEVPAPQEGKRPGGDPQKGERDVSRPKVT